MFNDDWRPGSWEAGQHMLLDIVVHKKNYPKNVTLWPTNLTFCCSTLQKKKHFKEGLLLRFFFFFFFLKAMFLLRAMKYVSPTLFHALTFLTSRRGSLLISVCADVMKDINSRANCRILFSPPTPCFHVQKANIGILNDLNEYNCALFFLFLFLSLVKLWKRAKQAIMVRHFIHNKQEFSDDLRIFSLRL